jgi:hypothetical protein
VHVVHTAVLLFFPLRSCAGLRSPSPSHNDRSLARQREYATFDESISEALIHSLAKVGFEGSKSFARSN